jgi:NADH-quinone oxidoreductase subunit N
MIEFLLNPFFLILYIGFIFFVIFLFIPNVVFGFFEIAILLQIFVPIVYLLILVPSFSISNLVVFMLFFVFGTLLINLSLNVSIEVALFCFIFASVLNVFQLTNLFELFYTLELQTFIIFVLTILDGTKKSLEAVLKYFFVNVLGSSFFFFGSCFFFIGYGTLDICDLKDIFDICDKKFLEIGKLAICCLLISFCIKLALVPFHQWIIDFYEGIRFSILFYTATISKFTVVVIYIIIITNLWQIVPWFILTIISLASIILGTIGGFNQIFVSRFLAYSTISHVGMISLSICINTNDGYVNAYLYLLLYLLIIYFTLSLLWVEYSSVNASLENQFFGFSYINKFFSFYAFAAFFFLIGLPPFVGFFGKWLIFDNLITTINSFYIIAVICSVLLSTFYYIRVIKYLYFEEPNYGLTVAFLKPLDSVVDSYDFSKDITMYIVIFLFFLNCLFLGFLGLTDSFILTIVESLD